MKIYTRIVLDLETGAILEQESYDYDGPIDRLDRALQQKDTSAAGTAGTAAGTAGATAAGIGANLVPYQTQQMLHPAGESQRDIGAQLTQSLAGTGGATAGLTGAADKMSATTRNPMGFSSALDAAARARDKGGAQAGADVAAENVKVKLGQQADASKGLAGLYGVNQETMGREGGIQNDALANAVKAGDSGWLQNTMGVMDSLGNLATGAGKLLQGARS